MKTIIAGSREGVTPVDVLGAIERADFSITAVVCGMARGADSFGLAWAEANGIPVECFPADWERHGKRAGFIRNVEMAEAADALILVWTGSSRGSRHMLDTARARGLRVLSYVPGACRHCEQWTRRGCKLGNALFPGGGAELCGDFWRQPGSDDEIGDDSRGSACAGSPRGQSGVTPQGRHSKGREGLKWA